MAQSNIDIPELIRIRVNLFFLVVLLSACTNTSFVKSCKAPDAGTITPDSFKKIMVAILVKDETTRRYAEDRMAEKNSAFHQSHDIFTSKELMGNTEYCKKLLQEEGFDGIISMQLVNVEESVHHVPGTYTGGHLGVLRLFLSRLL